MTRRTRQAPSQHPSALPGRPEVARLDNGMTVCVLENPQAPVVTSAIFYKVGTRDEPIGHGGIAHFLEHMMFKGSARYGPGEVDRRTLALGGSNNAFTSQDLTAYYFNMASDRWRDTLEIEVDRAVALTLDPKQVASERQVVIEEILMYASEPWDALEMSVHQALFPGHPYGKPILGTREELLATDEAVLAGFHGRFYRPDNAVFVVAGDVGKDALAAVAEAWGALPGGGTERRPFSPPTAPLSSLTRLTRHHGDVARFILALPAPHGADPDHGTVKLLADVLGGGRTSRLQRALVDELQYCVSVSADVSEGLDASQLMIAAEVMPGIEPERVEAEILSHLEALAAAPVSGEELERARRVSFADWVFGHERVHQQAVSAGVALALFDLEHLDRHLSRLLEATPDDLFRIAGRQLDPSLGAVLGWSLPEEDGQDADDAADDEAADIDGEDVH
jgi:zinc protease